MRSGVEVQRLRAGLQEADRRLDVPHRAGERRDRCPGRARAVRLHALAHRTPCQLRGSDARSARCGRRRPTAAPSGDRRPAGGGPERRRRAAGTRRAAGPRRRTAATTVRRRAAWPRRRSRSVPAAVDALSGAVAIRPCPIPRPEPPPCGRAVVPVSHGRARARAGAWCRTISDSLRVAVVSLVSKVRECSRGYRCGVTRVECARR